MRYDTIIVGAGSAGAALAARLSVGDPKRSVLLIEAGPDYPTLEQLPEDLRRGTPTGTVLEVDSMHDWAFVGRGTDARTQMPIARGKVTGGSSAINGQIFLRGLPEDYDGWAAAGNDGWRFDDVLPYLRRSEDDRDYADGIHRQGGPIGVGRFGDDELLPGHRAFQAAARSLGYDDCPDHNEPSSTGVGPYPLNCPDGVRVSTAIGYLPMARGNANFTLMADALVTAVVFDGTRAVGVAVESRDGGRSVIEGGEIVLSAGAIGSPHLLLLSGVGPADQLEALGIGVVADRPGVGQHLQDHPTVFMTWEFAPQHVTPVGAPLVQTALRYTAQGSDRRNDMWVCPLTWGAHMMMVPGIHAPDAIGELRLVSTDPRTQPSLDYRYLEDESDRRRLREGVRVCLALADQDALRELLGPRVTPTDDDVASDEALDAWIASVAMTSHHIAGTCKMGPSSDPSAVVDAQGRVHGLAGLRVVDASIIPEIPRANTNATTIMIAEKLAETMLERAGPPAT